MLFSFHFTFCARPLLHPLALLVGNARHCEHLTALKIELVLYLWLSAEMGRMLAPEEVDAPVCGIPGWTSVSRPGHAVLSIQLQLDSIFDAQLADCKLLWVCI